MSVSPRHLAEVFLKVWAVTLLVEAVLSIPTVVGQLLAVGADGGARGFRIVGAWTFLSVALTAVVATWLLKASAHLAERLVPVDAGGSLGGNVQAAAFGVLGTYFLVLGLRDGAGLAFRAATKPFGNDTLSYLWQGSGEAVVGTIVQCIAGLVLILGRAGIASGLRRLRGDSLP
jgi:hypothetical protein